ncbi:Broad specificity phosphatase PhoE [Cribrihabitans marinus]|uniref:Broad specificity phosphatase PhoE n=1 Tax=Cribrihabitans marinus TaxID=1227549 RepID=A0A1H7DCR4_9RHOB|nr:histidine phosphatase family protein [Cribrihabitans marinus]GGH37610.1 phosphoglycerate mutase [Cribrihabitans marinus]SEJ96025.1 Broad specificity phosphatase PhoE [Cribrihabitans marinus]
MARLVFVTHPDVRVEPALAIPDWGLSAEGRRRAADFAGSPRLASVSAIWSSAEAKAHETALILARALDLPVKVDAQLGENDRSATGYLPPEEFERTAEAFFAAPEQSFRGWERAIDAQERIHAAVRRIVAGHGTGDLMVVSHGAVGTLLYCRLRGLAIDRRHDQPHQGHWWSAELPALVPRHGWRPVG